MNTSCFDTLRAAFNNSLAPLHNFEPYDMIQCGVDWISICANLNIHTRFNAI